MTGLQEERSLLAKAVAALVADPSVKPHFLVNARTGGAALWVFARTRHRADHLVGLLSDYDYSFLGYYGEEGVADVHRADPVLFELGARPYPPRELYRPT